MKKTIIIKSIIILILLLGIGSMGYIYFKKPKLEVIKTEIEVKSDVKLSDLVKVVSGGKLVNGSVFLDSSTVGEKSIIVNMRNLINSVSSYELQYKVIDTIAPEVKADDTLFIVRNGIISDIMSQISITDNSGLDTTYTIQGQYDLEVPGKYSVTVNVADAGGNVTTIERALIVEISGSQATYFKTDNGFAGYQKDGVTYIDGILIANKTYSLPENYGDGLTEEFIGAYNRMKTAAANDGIELTIVSGYRSWKLQDALFKMYCEDDGEAEALMYSAKPGHSEHQTGLAADMGVTEETFETTKEFKWLNENAWKYGFILRYTKDGVYYTGYQYEPWHFRYVGENLAKILYNDGNWLNIEQYFGISSQYSD
ncbi:MAG: M15 family metallopeptidase [Erysipelotrichaceae bacterium]|nr:M15 family metallopeptidase [Erysipelotrichaceae bacterium]